SDTQTRSIEFEFRFFLGRNTDSDLELALDFRLKKVKFLVVVDDRNAVFMSVVNQSRDVSHVLIPLKTVANDESALVDFALFQEILNNRNVKCRRSLDMDVVLES